MESEDRNGRAKRAETVKNPDLAGGIDFPPKARTVKPWNVPEPSAASPTKESTIGIKIA